MVLPNDRRPHSYAGPPTKRPRPPRDSDEEPDEVEEEEEERGAESQPELVYEPGPEQLFEAGGNWARPPLPALPTSSPLHFQLIDVDNFTETATEDGKVKETTAVLRMFGVTKEGHSVACHVRGFRPYFYVEAPPSLGVEKLDSLETRLERVLLTNLQHPPRGLKKLVLGTELVEGESIYGFNRNQKSLFIKITLALPRFVTAAKKIMEAGELNHPDYPGMKAYEANIDFEIRFMVDLDITGGCWVKLKADKYSLVTDRQERKSRCQIEAEVEAGGLEAMPSEGEWSEIAPFRILSFDIECAGRRGVFPEPEHDRVIQIASVVKLQGADEPFVRNVFVLGSCAPIVGAQVKSFEKEKDLLHVSLPFLAYRSGLVARMWLGVWVGEVLEHLRHPGQRDA